MQILHLRLKVMGFSFVMSNGVIQIHYGDYKFCVLHFNMYWNMQVEYCNVWHLWFLEVSKVRQMWYQNDKQPGIETIATME